jgi:uncharacterized protein
MLKCGVCGFENKVPETCSKCGSIIERYVKAIPLYETDDVSKVKKELDAGNVCIVNVLPLFRKICPAEDFSEMRKIVDELNDYALSIGGDAARIGNKRLILTPAYIRIWDSALQKRTKTQAATAGCQEV